MKVVINDCIGGYSLSKKAYKYLGLKWNVCGDAYEDDRSNPKLVECVEKLGKEAFGRHAKLKIIEITDGIDWEIHESDDGREWVAEKHRTWG